MGSLEVFNKDREAGLVCLFLLRLFPVVESLWWGLKSAISSVSDEVGFAIYGCFLLALSLAEVLACLWCVLELAGREIAHSSCTQAEISLSEFLPLLIACGLVYKPSLSERLVNEL